MPQTACRGPPWSPRAARAHSEDEVVVTSEQWEPAGPYTRFPHEVLEAIASGGFTGAEARVLLAIARLSWGYHQIASVRGVRKIAAVCGMQPSAASRAIRGLERRRVVEKEEVVQGQETSVRIIEQVRLWLPPTPRKPRKAPRSAWKPKVVEDESVDEGVNTSAPGSVDTPVNRGVDVAVNSSVDEGVNSTNIVDRFKDRGDRRDQRREPITVAGAPDREVIP